MTTNDNERFVVKVPVLTAAISLVMLIAGLLAFARAHGTDLERLSSNTQSIAEIKSRLDILERTITSTNQRLVEIATDLSWIRKSIEASMSLMKPKNNVPSGKDS